MTEYKRNCPSCGVTLQYARQGSFDRAGRKNAHCRECYMTNELRNKISISTKAAMNNDIKKKISIAKLGHIPWNKGMRKVFELKRICPECAGEIEHKNKASFYHSRKHKRLCLECGKEKNRQRLIERNKSIKYFGKDNHFYGKTHSPETLFKCSRKGAKLNEESRRKCRNNASNQPRRFGRTVDKGQLELLDKWNKLGFNFEPNYKFHTDECLYFIDGYDKEKNVVLEYDSKYHNKPAQKEKDLIRQKNIINILKPKKFWRYNDMKKEFRNVVKDGYPN